jgi:cyclopropane-fatty-acyl-phospholipid synthase
MNVETRRTILVSFRRLDKREDTAMVNQITLAALKNRVAGIGMPLAVECWNGLRIQTDDQPRAKLFIRRPSALTAFLNPKLGKLAEHYVSNAIDFEGDTADMIELGNLLCPTGDVRVHRATFSGLGKRLLRWPSSDRESIAHHYDVSNDFYALWLDRQRIYSCAYFKTEADSLDVAQEQKLEHICRKLLLKPNERFLDVGCGWGGLLFWAAQHYGVRAVGITLSEQQYDYVKHQIKIRGLTGQVEVRLQHYADVPADEQFDKIASVGMFEHVGLRKLPSYFAGLYNLLKPGGLLLNHGITAGSPQNTQGLGGDISEFIEKYVFPGGQLVHLCKVIELASSNGFDVADVECWRSHYARTLWQWVERLDAHREAAVGIVGDERYRIWRIYMAGSAHAFARGWISIYQVLAAKPLANGAINHPPTRAHLYA